MRILYLHQYFKTPEEGGAIRSWHIANSLAKAGHEVEVISSHNSESYEKVKMNGFIVHYLPVNYHNSMGFVQRTLSFMNFMFKALWLTLRLKEFDKTFATSTPLTIGLVALSLKFIKKTPYIFEVRDLWPEAPIQLGFIKNPFLKQILYFFEKLLYTNSEKTVALSPGIEKGIQIKSPLSKVIMVPNMSDIEGFTPELKNPDFEQLFGVEKKFVISYTGAIGFSNHMIYLLEAASYCKEENLDVHFLVAGEGSQRIDLEQYAKKWKLLNVSFLGHQSKENLNQVLIISDAVYISFAPYPILETNSPNKFFDGIAAGKAIITNTKGWIKELIEDEEIGFYYNPNSKEEFLEKIKSLIYNAGKLKTAQLNARKLAENRFSVEKLTREINQLFS